jgi:protein-disulfide isomerase
MPLIRLRTLLLLGAVTLLLGAAESPQSRKLDKSRFEAYVRFAEGFTPNVKLSVDDPAPSAFEGFSRLVVHVSLGAQHFIRVYYAMPDGQHFVNGAIWDLNKSPQLDTLERLPTSGPAFGPESAKVMIVVFSDFECPYCRQLAQTIRANLPKKYPDDVRVVFEDFPLDTIHPWARPMAEAAHCLGDGNNAAAFWAFHDWAFEHQQEIKPENMREKVLAYAADHGLNVPNITTCIDSHGKAEEVRSYQAIAETLQVQQTPTLFVNGRMLNGALPWETIDAVIRLELDRPKDILPDGGASCCEVPIPTVTRK